MTISILAVFVAGITLLGHRAHTEELLLQSQATDQWAFYQAKNIRLHEMQSMVDLLGTIAPLDKEKNAKLQEKYQKKWNATKATKKTSARKPRIWKKSATSLSRRADRFDGGEALLEIGLVICSITLLTKRRVFWIAGMRIGGGRYCLCGDWFPGALVRVATLGICRRRQCREAG